MFLFGFNIKYFAQSQGDVLSNLINLNVDIEAKRNKSNRVLVLSQPQSKIVIFLQNCKLRTIMILLPTSPLEVLKVHSVHVAT